MNNSDLAALLSSLDCAVDILERNRTPDPAVVAAYDTLKQARAHVIQSLDQIGKAQREARLAAA